MSLKKEQKVLLNILRKYRSMPLLWQKDHDHYLNKNMRADCYKVLLKIYKNFNGKVTMKHMKKKIENMRTTYLKELKKVLASKYTGSGTNKVYSYVPTLWYYEELNFLSNDGECVHNATVTDSYESVDSSDDETLASVAISNSGRRKRKRKDTRSPSYEENKAKSSTGTDMIRDDEEYEVNRRKIQHTQETNTSHDEEIENNRRKVSYSVETNTNNDEECKVYGRSIGYQMKDLNKRQLMISQKIISDVLYYAKLDQLSEYTCLVLEPANDPVLPNIAKFYSMS